MDQQEVLATATELLFREAEFIDQRFWDGWIDLFTADCVFWVPSWISEEKLCTDPAAQVSMMYYTSRSGLSDRIWRIRSGQSVASTPMPRTMHLIGNIRAILTPEGGSIVSKSNFSVDLFYTKNNECQRFFGFYDHTLTRERDDWKIAAKKITLLNDNLPSVLDIYCL